MSGSHKLSTRRLLIALGCLLPLATPTALAIAATVNWTGSVSDFWNTSGNWDNGVPGPGDDVIFTSSSRTNTKLDIDFTVQNVTFASGAPTNFAISANSCAEELTI